MNPVPAFGPNDLNVIFIGVAIVFLILILITAILYLFPLFFRRKGKKKSDKTELQVIDKNHKLPAKDILPEADGLTGQAGDEELAAVISAAIAAYTADAGNGTSFRVRSFRHVGGRNGSRQ